MKTPPFNPTLLEFLRCPVTQEKLTYNGNQLITEHNKYSYNVSPSGIPLFAENIYSDDGYTQQQHYDKIANAYTANLNYPHTKEYTHYLDQALEAALPANKLGNCAEICCGTGEGVELFYNFIDFGLGVDISKSMLEMGLNKLNSPKINFIQGDATQLPLADNLFDTVIMLGGIHHVENRQALFEQIYRILKPGGVFIFREPVSDFWPWKLLRSIIYRVSPMLDHLTERPLTFVETVPVLKRCGFTLPEWKTYGFIGFCIFMNSDVLFFNRFFRYLPGIRGITRFFVNFDDWITRRSYFRTRGLQVIGAVTKPKDAAN